MREASAATGITRGGNNNNDYDDDDDNENDNDDDNDDDRCRRSQMVGVRPGEQLHHVVVHKLLEHVRRHVVVEVRAVHDERHLEVEVSEEQHGQQLQGAIPASRT